jgi:hypothetical protein
MKFTSIILALLLAPSKADHPASGSGSDAAAGRLGGKSTRMLMSEEEAMMGGGGGGKDNSNSCAAAYPGIAVEQVALSYLVKIAVLEIVDEVGGPYNAFQIPSFNAFVTSNYDPSKDYPPVDPVSIFLLINRVYSEMSCEEYTEGQEASLLLKLITGDLPFGPWGAMTSELRVGALGEEMAVLAGNVNVEEEAAAYGFNFTGSD